MRTNFRRAATALALATIALAAVPALSASIKGGISHDSLTPAEAVAGVVDLDWTWTGGTKVNSQDAVNVTVSTDGTSWSPIARRLPIRDGHYAWDTTAVPDGSYYVRYRVAGHWIFSDAVLVTVDNTAPLVRITRPTTDQIIVDDTTPGFAIVAGNATLEARALDVTTGVTDVTWLLGEEQIASGDSATYNFSANPGPHTLTAVATDGAGNTASHSIEILALAGPSAAVEGAPEIPEGEFPPEGGEEPELPDLGETPGLPDLGEEPTLPTLPEDGGDPDPDPDPTPTPSPTLPDPGSEPELPEIPVP